MNNILSGFFTVVIIFVFTGCDTDIKIDNYKSNEILAVTIEIEDDIEIEKITLNSNKSLNTDSISLIEIGEKKIFDLKCPQKGEGTFSVCVFTKSDTLCSAEIYAEGGYRPKLKLKAGKFEVMEWF
ncbi:MAG TPA: hypothetical protein DCY06_05985 [Bacteroidetes bacterium]|nr:hypothetical protein [Bacteroidota bacterium]HRJ98287.1 hypothetical protein [Ignavibacteria bacterium]